MERRAAMMNSPYDLHSWSKQYRGETLLEARKQHLARSDVSRLNPASLLLVILVLVAILLGASACTDSASSSASSDTDASNFAGMRSSSMECYAFYSDGTVELRHGGTSTVSDSGSYQGDEDFGEVVWDSGRWTSTVVAEGDGLIIDDLKVSPVTSCF
jgi:hypothetical protein